MLPNLLGIDIGGTKTAIVVGDENGGVVERLVFPSDAGRGYGPMLKDILTAANNLLQRFPTIAAVGAVAGGPLDAEKGIVLSPPHLPGWDTVPLAKDLESLGLPVRIEHDAKAGALAEWRFGAGRDCTDMVFLTLGTGIGAGIISGGRLLRGTRNAAGEIGHWRMRETGPDLYGKPGSLEGLASGAGIAKHAREMFPSELADIADARDLGERALRREAAAMEAIASAGDILGHSIAMLIDLLAPQKIVLGSLAQRLGTGFTAPMRVAIERETLPSTLANCEVVEGELGDGIGDVAALCIAIEALHAAKKN